MILQYYQIETTIKTKDKAQDIKNLYALAEKKGHLRTLYRNNNKVKQIVLTQMDINHREVLVEQLERTVESFEDERRLIRHPLLRGMINGTVDPEAAHDDFQMKIMSSKKSDAITL